jgi:hypothetical protein
MATLFSFVSLVGIFFGLWTITATICGMVCGLVNDRVWRSIAAAVALLGFITFSFFSLIVGLVWSIVGLGLLLLVGTMFGIAATVACVVELISSINGSSQRAGGWSPGYAAPAPPVVIYNQNMAQVGDHYSGNAVHLSGAQVSVIDAGRPQPPIPLQVGSRLVVGRGPDADIRLSDPRVSRHHLAISVDGQGYRLADLNSTNPARIIAGGRQGQMLSGGQTLLASGQVVIGESIITLYPMG